MLAAAGVLSVAEFITVRFQPRLMLAYSVRNISFSS